MPTLIVQCPRCEYRDQGGDTDLIMTDYMRHEKECTGHMAGFFMPNLGETNEQESQSKD